MIQKEFVITNPTGLHTRPGNDFVKMAKQFVSEIQIRKGDKTVDGKSLLKVMKANITQGDTLSIACNGPDEEEALRSLENFLSSLKE